MEEELAFTYGGSGDKEPDHMAAESVTHEDVVKNAIRSASWTAVRHGYRGNKPEEPSD